MKQAKANRYFVYNNVIKKNNRVSIDFLCSKLSIKADGALPVLHIIFDTASEEDGSQVLYLSTR